MFGIKRVLAFFVALSLFSVPGSDARQEKSLTKEEKARLDTFLASQEQGKPIEGEILKKPLETHPSKKWRIKEGTQREPVKKRLEGRSTFSQKLGEREEPHRERESRFKPEQIQKRLETGRKIEREVE